jgi:hypothetical protein
MVWNEEEDEGASTVLHLQSDENWMEMEEEKRHTT